MQTQHPDWHAQPWFGGAPAEPTWAPVWAPTEAAPPGLAQEQPEAEPVDVEAEGAAAEGQPEATTTGAPPWFTWQDGLGTRVDF